MQVTRESKRFSLCLAAAYCVLGLGLACGSSTKNTGGNTGDTNTTAKCTLSGGTDYTDSQAATAFVPPACQSTMYAKYGSAGFTAVNSNIITLATSSTANPNVAQLGTSFQTEIVQAGSTRISQFTSNLANFLILAYGGPDNYTGSNSNARSMLAAHGGLNITTAQYSSFISNVVVPALTEAGVSSADITNCFAPQVTDPNFKASIISCQ